MTTFKLSNASGSVCIELDTDLIGLTSENLTVMQTRNSGTEVSVSSETQDILNTFDRNKHSQSEILKYAQDHGLELITIEANKARTQTRKNYATPGDFTATVESDTEITLGWIKTPGAAGYIVTRSTQADFSSGNTVSTLGNVNTLAVTGLTTATHYYFRIQSIYNSDYSGYAYADGVTE